MEEFGHGEGAVAFGNRGQVVRTLLNVAGLMNAPPVV